VKGAKRSQACRVDSRNRVTIPVDALVATGIEAGDRLLVNPEGPGRIVLEVARNPIREFAGSMTGCWEPGELDRLRDEWD
jgi:bifunctional DNA-binding transcriptional regulator/antitoxin component of YhaV-PrlF toxin-antitoxin module